MKSRRVFYFERGQMSKAYLGDSVYAEFDGYGITLTTDNGYGPSNAIYLEPAVVEALNRFLKSLKEDAEAKRFVESMRAETNPK